MISTKEVIMLLKQFKSESASKYGITSLGLFGSFARNQQQETSDVDIFVSLRNSFKQNQSTSKAIPSQILQLLTQSDEI